MVEEIEVVIQSSIQNKSRELVTKPDIFDLKEAILKLDTKISETKANLLKWIIILFAPFYAGMIVFLIKLLL